MTRLSPLTAAELAREVYAVQDETRLKIFMLRPEFSESRTDKQHLTAHIGGWLIRNATDGFGVCAAGGKDYENDIFLIFRGSTRAHDSADWVSNFKIGLDLTNTGRFVHVGFLNILRSMKEEIESFLSSHSQKTGTVHCIGHSLGGAIATLAADWVSTTNRFSDVKLYTFGAPKPGLTFFSSAITSRIGIGNIHRVYHATDPVPMIPLFPFVHPPHRDYGHYVPSNQNILSAEAHNMGLYRDAMESLSWQDLKRIPPQFTSEDAIEEWLKSKIKVDPNSSKTWEWLNEALIYILKKSVNTGVLALEAGIIGLVTVADKLAWLLFHAKKIVVGAWEGAVWVFRLIQKAMDALGMAVAITMEDLTQTLIRNVIERLMRKTIEVARKAVQNLTRY